MHMRTRSLHVGLAALLTAAVPSHAFLGGLLGSETETKQDNAEMNLGEYKGIKHAVGVMEFENTAGWRGRWELGPNLSVMLESALFDSGRFIVLEREKLGAVLAEQNLAASGRAAGGTQTAQTGKVRLARYIATGAIVEVSDDTQGTDGGINIKGFRIGASGGKSQIAVIVKLVDTTTGEVVAKERVEGQAGKRGLRVGYSGSTFGGDLGGFNKTPIGEAAQDVIVQAVEFLAKSMEEFPLEGTVVKADEDGSLIINRGSEFNIAPGQEFTISEPGEELIDPDTGALLGREEGKVISKIKIDKVTDKISYGKVIDGAIPKRGDSVSLK